MQNKERRVNILTYSKNLLPRTYSKGARSKGLMRMSATCSSGRKSTLTDKCKNRHVLIFVRPRNDSFPNFFKNGVIFETRKRTIEQPAISFSRLSAIKFKSPTRSHWYRFGCMYKENTSTIIKDHAISYPLK